MIETGDDFPNAESLLEELFRLEAANSVASASGLTSTTGSVTNHDASKLPKKYFFARYYTHGTIAKQ